MVLGFSRKSPSWYRIVVIQGKRDRMNGNMRQTKTRQGYQRDRRAFPRISTGSNPVGLGSVVLAASWDGSSWVRVYGGVQ